MQRAYVRKPFWFHGHTTPPAFSLQRTTLSQKPEARCTEQHTACHGSVYMWVSILPGPGPSQLTLST